MVPLPRIPLFSLLLVACNPPSGDTKRQDPAPEVEHVPPLGPTFDEVELLSDEAGLPPPDSGEPFVEAWPAPPALRNAEETSLAFQTVLSGPLAEPFVLIDAYLETLSHGSMDCPLLEGLSVLVDHSGCNTPEGWNFAGFSGFEERRSGGYRFDLSTDLEIRRPDGTRFTASGRMSLRISGSREILFGARGDYMDDARTDLLGQGWRPYFLLEVASDGTGTLDGPLHLQGEDLSFETVSFGPTCPTGAGRVGLRDPAGGWWWATLDCSGCGTLIYEDDPDSSEICIDLSLPLAETLLALEPPVLE